MLVVNIVNSIVGKVGNIGLRTAYIVDELARQQIGQKLICRGAVDRYLTRETSSMGLVGQLPRVMNAYRIYVNRKFGSRKYDLKLFNYFVKRQLSQLPRDERHKVAHVWDYCPEVLRALREAGFVIILEIPIAPTACSAAIEKKYAGIINDLKDYMIQLERESLALADRLIVPSEFVKEAVIAEGISKDKISLVPFGAEQVPDSRLKVQSEESEKREALSYCFAGNINLRKGVGYLLEAWDDEVFSRDSLTLYGRLFPEVRELLNERKLKNVYTPGFVDLQAMLSQHDVYVFPSLFEGSSKSIYEAMSFGLPIITTHNSGSIVSDGIEGFVIPVGDVVALREKMNHFRENRAAIRELGANAVSKVRAYTWQKYAESLIKIYQTTH